MVTSFVRTLILYFVIIFAIRLMGKRQVGQLQPTELVITILVSELASVPMQDFGIPLVHGIIPILTLVCAEVLISVITLHNIRIRNLLSGKPVLIINNGVIDQEKLKQVRLNVDDVLEELRLKDIPDISRVRFAQFETSGQLSVILSPDQETVNAGMMKIKTPDVGPAKIIISDGKLLQSNLNEAGKDFNWLRQILKKRDAPKIENIFIMTLDPFDNVVVIKKEKNK